MLTFAGEYVAVMSQEFVLLDSAGVGTQEPQTGHCLRSGTGCNDGANIFVTVIPNKNESKAGDRRLAIFP